MLCNFIIIKYKNSIVYIICLLYYIFFRMFFILYNLYLQYESSSLLNFTRTNASLNGNSSNKAIKKLEQEIINEKNNNEILLEKIKKFENINEELISNVKKINDELLNLNSNKNDKINLLEELRIQDKIISNFPLKLLEGEKLLSIIFESIDKKIHYSCVCKNTDIFNKIENMLYEKYPEYLNSENNFYVNGNKINKYQSIEFNKIENSDIIMLNNTKQLLYQQ